MNWRDYRLIKKESEDKYFCKFCQCNFNDAEYKITNDKNKCIFHCDKLTWITKDDPKDNDYNLSTEIVYFLNEKKIIFFWNKFKELVEEEINLSEDELYSRFSDFIFPELEESIFRDYSFKSDLVFNKNCSFEGNINFFKTIFNGKVYFDNCKIKGNISFGKSIFKDRFIFNNMKEIKKVCLRFAEFEKKVEFKESACKEIDLENTVFKSLCDFYKSKFTKVNFARTDFEKVSVFSETEFNCDVDFKYTKFLGKTIFRDTVISGKLNLRDTIFDAEANFLDITSIKRKQNEEKQFIDEPTDIKVANRETARVIKNFYDNSNNIIEANRFYKLEMNARLDEFNDMKFSDYRIFEKLVFLVHWISSNHSQNWLLSLFWIINLTYLYSYVLIQDFLLECKTSNTEICTEYYNLIHMIHPAFSNYLLYVSAALTMIAIPSLIMWISEEGKRKTFHSMLVLMLVNSYVLYAYISYDYKLKFFSNTINPFSIMMGNQHLIFLTLFYKVVIAYLTYQLIISIRQNTRRK
ncbi:conserved hypothetical protein [Arcobacter nitrofigilis DSM 7299]|uniref:Pentapeptide repeat protein n=1 Tax=Arcobacter nitrofigilis (strain ATCC 33309 / DSM 7299 / CCUG 15893 / LMG 7604 / NCTC 12251 / CI) TaxID=572480 RepID=D5V286_ARCNC|nr:pentapeptide repeat-containing protein [Arcobacter nitrofigilis]ADG92319.1 conserved hypothetical protein [Arcobacter nitrofigilis DSM 7299]